MSDRGGGRAADAYVSDTRDLVALFTGVLAPPLAFLVNLQIAYTAVSLDCAGSPPWVHASSLVTLALAFGAGLLAWRRWARVGRGWPEEGGSVAARNRFLAITGMLSTALFSLLILAQWAALLFLRPCDGI